MKRLNYKIIEQLMTNTYWRSYEMPITVNYNSKGTIKSSYLKRQSAQNNNLFSYPVGQSPNGGKDTVAKHHSDYSSEYSCEKLQLTKFD